MSKGKEHVDSNDAVSDDSVNASDASFVSSKDEESELMQGDEPVRMSKSRMKQKQMDEIENLSLNKVEESEEKVTTPVLNSSEAVVIQSGKLPSEELVKEVQKAVPEIQSEEVKEVPTELKAQRGIDRFKQVLNEKKQLESDVENLKEHIRKLEAGVKQYQIEDELAKKIVEHLQVESTKEDKSISAKLDFEQVTTEIRQTVTSFLNSKRGGVDHAGKAILFNDYFSNAFNLYNFAKAYEKNEWDIAIQGIYEALSVPKERDFTLQPIRSRTSTLGSPANESGSPIERISEYLKNMGV